MEDREWKMDQSSIFDPHSRLAQLLKDSLGVLRQGSGRTEENSVHAEDLEAFLTVLVSLLELKLSQRARRKDVLHFQRLL
jgi:hypothetical protein